MHLYRTLTACRVRDNDAVLWKREEKVGFNHKMFLILALTPLFLRFYSLETQTVELIIWLVVIHNVFNALVFLFSGALGNGLRAIGDVKFTMLIAIGSTVGVRFVLSYLFGVIFHMGVIGIALAMCLDWLLRAVVYYWRMKSGKWKDFQVI